MEDAIKASFHKASIHQIQTCLPEVTSPKPLPREITIVFRHNQQLIDSIALLQAECKLLAPTLFYYPPEQLHLTILGNVPLNTDISIVEEIIRNAWRKKRFEFRFWGAGMGKFSTSISAYPINFSLHGLRSDLRNELGIQGTDFTVHLPEYEYVGWTNISRNVDSVPNDDYRSLVLSKCEEEFGTFLPVSVEILENESWVLDPKKITILKEIVL